MPVSGIVVRCLGSCSDSVANQIAALEGVEVHGVMPNGQIIAVIEADTVDGEVALVTELQGIEDVISVQLAYHNFEDFEAERP